MKRQGRGNKVSLSIVWKGRAEAKLNRKILLQISQAPSGIFAKNCMNSPISILKQHVFRRHIYCQTTAHANWGFHRSQPDLASMLLISLLYYLSNQFLHAITNNPATAALPLPTPVTALQRRLAGLLAVPQAPQLAKEPYYLFIFKRTLEVPLRIPTTLWRLLILPEKSYHKARTRSLFLFHQGV